MSAAGRKQTYSAGARKPRCWDNLSHVDDRTSHPRHSAHLRKVRQGDRREELKDSCCCTAPGAQGEPVPGATASARRCHHLPAGALARNAAKVRWGSGLRLQRPRHLPGGQLRGSGRLLAGSLSGRVGGTLSPTDSRGTAKPRRNACHPARAGDGDALPARRADRELSGNVVGARYAAVCERPTARASAWSAPLPRRPCGPAPRRLHPRCRSAPPS